MKKIFKKFVGLVTTFAYILVTLIPVPILADPLNPTLVLDGATGLNGNHAVYYNGPNVAGEVCVKQGGECIAPTIENNNATYVLTAGNVTVETIPNDGYNIDQDQYKINNGETQTMSNGSFSLSVENDHNYEIDMQFVGGSGGGSAEEPGDNPGGEPQNNDAIVKLDTPNDYTAEIDSVDTKKINYKSNGTLVGSAKLKVGSNYITPVMDGTNVKFDVDDYTDTAYKAYAEYTMEPGYSMDDYYHINGTQGNVADNKVEVNINSNTEYRVEFGFIQGSNENAFSVIAYFSGINNGFALTDDHILIPNDWTTGIVTFKTPVCDASNGSVIPDDGETPCTNNRELPLKIEGIANGVQINETVRSNGNRIEVLNGFDEFGKVSLHLVKANLSDPEINLFVNLINEELINVKAISPIGMSYSLGSNAIDQALLTNTNSGDVSIFFGNTETTLEVAGVRVQEIESATGGKSTRINNDGTVTIELPELSKETTTTVNLAIKLYDGTTIHKTVNIKRTAILLQHSYGGGDDTVYAGYVVNKGYLYNNSNHNDAIFNAYLQVMLYKDDVVVGYKQIKINDESLVNSLENNESGSMELYSQNQIPIYGKETNDLIDGVNKISVFLTDGPVDFNKALPSIEFGIGSGVTLEWGTL